ncbi:MAG TPA: NAD-dependent epimerase/dehydratase family protein [Candidatus Kapabacteria bacterium]|nr:NAD-dependent epimerase/dehydratase family protein [Candidatus Kapabacteria bacterium]
MKVIVTGVTGMVGEGVMHECLLDSSIEEVLVVGRRPSGFSHPKLKELVAPDMFDLSAIESNLSGYDACYFCLGVSSIGMSEEDYRHITYDLTMNFAKTLLSRNPAMSFCYVSGKSTDGSENGKLMWARVKGKTENDLIKLGFKQAFAFRPGIMEPTLGLKNTLKGYKFLSWLIPILRVIYPSGISTLAAVGRAMINVTRHGYPKQVMEVADIKAAASNE